jgi:hypothetical protein
VVFEQAAELHKNIDVMEKSSEEKNQADVTA